MDLHGIQDPSFLQELSIKELELLAQNIRDFLIANVSKTGGHLSSNLGAVELSIALHTVFESPKDKLIFDVGHQSYTHKILTGRAKQFSTLRKYNGLSGFLKRSESIHDVFEAGHSSTSIAAAAGFEFAKKYKGNSHKIVPIIGDGALTGGLAFEAMNFLGGHRDHQPIIVVNDNEMSISKNIGYLARILNGIRSKTAYRKLKTKTAKILPRFLTRLTSKVERGIKGFLSSNTLFDDLGFSYYGPINGHNMKELIKYLNIAKRSNKPCVIHVLTEKGKGYEFSEQDRIGSWHGTGPFNITSGKPLNEQTTHNHTWSEIVSHFMIDYAKKESDFCIVCPAMIAGSKLYDFQQQFPERIIDVGIAEQMAVTMSCGLALSNVHVFTPIYSTFIQRAYDQVSHDVARQNASVVFGIDRAGIVGGDGETHQGIYDIPLLRHIPNVTIVHPRTPEDIYGILQYAFNIHEGPFFIRYERGSITYDFPKTISCPTKNLSWQSLQQGSKAIFISFGTILTKLLDEMENKPLDIEIIDAFCIKPLDEDMLHELMKRGCPIVVYEESTTIGGFGSAILEFKNNHQYDVEIHTMALPDSFIAQGNKESILKEYNLNVASIIQLIQELS